MKTASPILTIPLLLALVAIALVVARFDASATIGVLTVSMAVSGYLWVRARRGDGKTVPVSRLLPLLPGHALVLLGIGLVQVPGVLPWLWMLVPIVTAGYDALGRKAASRTRKWMSILGFLYVILWADLFFLLERIIVLRRGMSGSEEVILATAFVLVGGIFLGLGIYRHWLAVKE